MKGGDARWIEEVRLNEKVRRDPLKWEKPRRVFVCGMSDLFHEKVPFEWIDRIFIVIALSPQLTFQVLTKRPERMLEYFSTSETRWTGAEGASVAGMGPDDVTGSCFGMFRGAECFTGGQTMVQEERRPLPNVWPNVWLGVSCEDQETADERIPLLLQTPAAIHWVSFEPALGSVDFGRYLRPGCAKLDWLVSGAESGPGARPAHPDWFRRARDDCRASGVPYFHKQNGEFLAPALFAISDNWQAEMVRVGKKRAGRLLDGREWSDYPAKRLAQEVLESGDG